MAASGDRDGGRPRGGARRRQAQWVVIRVPRPTEPRPDVKGGGWRPDRRPNREEHRTGRFCTEPSRARARQPEGRGELPAEPPVRSSLDLTPGTGPAQGVALDRRRHAYRPGCGRGREIVDRTGPGMRVHCLSRNHDNLVDRLTLGRPFAPRCSTLRRRGPRAYPT